jgi:hypothetical protein
MRDVFGSKNWIYWWAALTAAVFFRDQLPTIAQFFQDSGFFSPSTFPFSLVSGLNAWIDSVAQNIENSIQFNPQATLIAIGPVQIQAWVIAVLVGLLVLGGAIALYVRALKSSALGDDILALLALYFVLRVESYIIGLTDVAPLEGASNFLGNPLMSFYIMMFFLLVLVFMGGGLQSRRAFWRGLLEAVLIALFVVPAQTADLLGAMVMGLYTFTNLLTTNLVFGVFWGITGAVLAITRLTNPATA